MFKSPAIALRKALLPALALLLFAAVATARADDKVTREYRHELDLDPGGRVALDNPVGEVRITGWDRDVVLVKAAKKCDRKWFDKNRRKAEAALERVRIDVAGDRDGVRIETRYEDLEFDDPGADFLDTCKMLLGLIRKGLSDNLPIEASFEVMVPARVDLDVKCNIGAISVDGVEGVISVRGDIGEIKITDARGEITVRNDIGEIVVRNVVGTLDAGTSMGAVDADIASLGPEDRVKLESGMGEVRLRIPTDARADITADCGMGSIRNNLGEGFVCRVRDGDISGKLNGGGSPVSLKSGMGAISLNQR